jgi:imidazolonepropionase-like amidohydrolase
MRRQIFAAALLLSSILAVSLPALAQAPAPPVLIERVTVVSAERKEPLRNAFVLLQDGHIRSVGTRRPALSSAVKKNVRVIDGRGRFLVPGLIDSHVHVTTPPGITDPDFDRKHPGLLDAYWRQQPRSYLYHGVTAVVDLASIADLVERFRSAPQAPDLVTCGALILDGGYPAVLVPPALRAAFLRYALPADPAAAPAVVRRAQADGHRCIKLFFEDGFGASTAWPLPSDDVVAAVRAEARRLGLPVIIHANALDMQTAALRHKPDVLAHGLWNWGASDRQPGLPEPIRRHLAAVLAARVAVQPTFGVIEALGALFDPAFLDDPALKKVLPSALLAWYRTDEAQGPKNDLVADSPIFADPARARQIFAGVLDQDARATAYLIAHKGRILLGSDTPSGPFFTNPPGLNTWKELQHLAGAGLSPRGILEAATRRNAQVFGLSDRGTIEPGKTADLLLLSADPLKSVEAWNAIERVIVRGTVIPRESLAAE